MAVGVITYCERFWSWIDLDHPLWFVVFDGADTVYCVWRPHATRA